MWEWLEQREQLERLGPALRKIGRDDLVPLLARDDHVQHWQERTQTFTDRGKVIDEIAAWATASSATRQPVCFVTGGAGSGKSAVVGWFALDPETRRARAAGRGDATAAARRSRPRRGERRRAEHATDRRGAGGAGRDCGGVARRVAGEHTGCVEATGIYRRLAAAEPGAWLADLASAVHTLGVLQSEVGRADDASVSLAEAVQRRRELGGRAVLAQSLMALAAVLGENHLPADALVAAEDATEIYQERAAADPATYRADHASALTNLGIALWEVGEWDRGVSTTWLAVDEYRALRVYPADLAGALNNLGFMLPDMDQPDAAVAAAREAVDIYRALPAGADLAMALDTYAMACKRGNRDLVAGRAAAEEAVRIYEDLADRLPEAYGDALTSARETRDALNPPAQQAGRIR